MKHLDYKGYTGTIEYSREDELLYGKVMGIKDLLSYEGGTGTELEADFRNMIEEYLLDCGEREVKAEKPFKGSFNVRISSEIHRDAALKAMELQMSLNSFVSEAIRYYLNDTHLRMDAKPKNSYEEEALEGSAKSKEELVKK